MVDLETRIADLAEGFMRGRFRVERTEIVGKVLERLVLEVLDSDPRFHGSVKGLFWELASSREERELQRRRQEEADAEAAAGSGGLEPTPERLPSGPGRYVPVGAGEPPPLDDEELGAAV